MNPRIQVEHTVTEEVTDVDLVQSPRCGSPPARRFADLGLRQDDDPRARRRAAVPHHHRGPEPTASAPTPARSPSTARPAAPGCASTAAPCSSAPRSAPTSTRCWSSSPAADAPSRTAVAPGAKGVGGVPDSRRLDQHPLPRGRARRPGLPARRGHDQLHRRAARAARGPDRRRPRHQAAHLPRRRHGQPAARPGHDVHRAAHQAAGDRPRRPGARRVARPAGAGSGRPSSRGSCAPAADVRGHRHHLPRRPPVAAGHPGAHPRPAARRRSRRPPDAPSCSRWRRGAAPPTTSRCASCPRTRGSAWRCCARRCPTSRCRCCCAAATPSATPRTRPRSPTPSCTRPPHRASTSSGSSTRSTTSTQMRPAIEAVLDTGTAVAEVALCYTGDLLDPREKLYTLDYYLRLAEQIVDAGAHVLAIKDMAGLLRAPAATRLVTALRERFDLPVHLHTHDTAGGQLATLLAAIDAGVDAVDAASASMSGTTSQPSLSALVAATDGTERATGLDSTAFCDLEPYWEAVRQTLRPVRVGPGLAPPAASTSTRSPAASCPTCASRPSPSASATASRTSRTCMPRPTASSATWSRSPRPRRWSATSRWPWSAPVPTRTTSRRTPTKYDIPDSVIGFLERRARRPARRLARAVPHQGPAGPPRQAPHHRADGGAGGGAVGRPAAHPQPAALPRPHQGVRGQPRPLRQPVGARHHRVPARAGAGQ